MKKAKLLVTACVAIAVAASCGAFAACTISNDDGEDTVVTYTATNFITDENTTVFFAPVPDWLPANGFYADMNLTLTVTNSSSYKLEMSFSRYDSTSGTDFTTADSANVLDASSVSEGACTVSGNTITTTSVTSASYTLVNLGEYFAGYGMMGFATADEILDGKETGTWDLSTDGVADCFPSVTFTVDGTTITGWTSNGAMPDESLIGTVVYTANNFITDENTTVFFAPVPDWLPSNGFYADMDLTLTVTNGTSYKLEMSFSRYDATSSTDFTTADSANVLNASSVSEGACTVSGNTITTTSVTAATYTLEDLGSYFAGYGILGFASADDILDGKETGSWDLSTEGVADCFPSVTFTVDGSTITGWTENASSSNDDNSGNDEETTTGITASSFTADTGSGAVLTDGSTTLTLSSDGSYDCTTSYGTMSFSISSGTWAKYGNIIVCEKYEDLDNDGEDENTATIIGTATTAADGTTVYELAFDASGNGDYLYLYYTAENAATLNAASSVLTLTDGNGVGNITFYDDGTYEYAMSLNMGSFSISAYAVGTWTVNEGVVSLNTAAYDTSTILGESDMPTSTTVVTDEETETESTHLIIVVMSQMNSDFTFTADNLAALANVTVA